MHATRVNTQPPRARKRGVVSAAATTVTVPSNGISLYMHMSTARQPPQQVDAATCTSIAHHHQASADTTTRRCRKENLRDFISRKREISLVQMTLENRLAEIRKLVRWQHTLRISTPRTGATRAAARRGPREQPPRPAGGRRTLCCIPQGKRRQGARGPQTCRKRRARPCRARG